MTESQHACDFDRVHDRYLEDLLRHLDGMFVNFEDALFEIAYRGGDSAEQGRCFDLMRTLRQRRSTLEHAFVEELRCIRRRAFGDTLDSAELDAAEQRADDVRLAMTISRKTRDHFTNLLEALRIKSEVLAGREFTGADELPFSPLCAARAFVRASEMLSLDPGSRHILYQMFERYVMDRLGPLLGRCNDALSELLEAHESSRGAG